MKIDKDIKRDIKQTDNEIIVTENETRNVNMTPDDLVELYKRWEQKSAQFDIETSDLVMSHMKTELELLKKVSIALAPFFKNDTKELPPNVMPVQSALNDLLMAYGERIKQIEKFTTPEYLDEVKKSKAELDKDIAQFKPFYNKVLLKRKVEEMEKQRGKHSK